MTACIRNYCQDNRDNIYFEPAISIAAHSYKLETIDNKFNNLMVLGGWNYSSPEWDEVIRSFGIETSVENSILRLNNAYIISEPVYIENIINYFKWKYGEEFSYEIVDKINYEPQEVYVYSMNVTEER